ncbi:MAG: hypothetical protein HZB38_06270 [Planctomycetes bacterium]|nr:hypothetical protein [Planctomycetota bacterium]
MNRFASALTAIVLSLGSIGGCPQQTPNPTDNGNVNSSGSAALDLFDEVWQTFDENYSYFEWKGIDWDAFYDAHWSDFDDNLSGDDFAQRLANALSELDDLHINVQTPEGEFLEVATRNVPQNYTSTPRNLYAASSYQTLGDEVVWHAWLTGDIAYIRVDTLSSDAYQSITTGQIEAIFAAYADAAGFVIDIRPNNGGNENIAQLFASHFTGTDVVYGYTETRNGPSHGDFDPIEEKVLQPAAENLFNGPVVCLIGARNMSSAEWFALMMRACGATLIGDVTRGSSGNPQEFPLSNGVTYTVPTWIAYSADFELIEDQGITPDLPVAPDESFDSSRDYVLEMALEVLAP